MKIAYFPTQIALNAKPVMDAFLQGCQQLGIKTVENSTEADAAVIWSVLWHGRMKSNESIYRLYRQQNKPVFVLEVGMLKRGLTWKLGVNSIGLDNSYAIESMPNRSKQLGINLAPWTNGGYNVVIACQRSDSEQWSGQPPTIAWLTETARKIRQHSDKPIVIRPHPRQRIANIPGCVIESPKPIPGTYDSFDYDQCLKTTWAVINHNSGPGTQAILNGVPAFVGSTSLASPVGNLDIADIENPLRPDRTQWIEQLAHTEWTIPEIESGLPLLRLLKP